MAEENVVRTNIVATSDMSSLIVDLNKVSLALSQLQERLSATNKNLALQAAVMNKAFAETLRSTGQFSTHFVSLTSDVDKFGQQLDKGQLKLGQFFRVYGDHVKSSGGLIRQLAQQQVQLQNAILQPLGRNSEGLMQYNVHIPRGLDLVKNKTAIARQELAIMNRVVQEGAGQLINWGKNTQWAGRQLTVGLTIPLAAFGKAAADAFRMADQELVRLTKVYGGLSATTSAELAKVRKDVSATASELARGYGASFKETISLAADIAATGKQGNELLGSVKETTRLAVLGEVDRQEAMKATLAIQTAFKQNTEELSESINFLNAVENQTSTTLQDLVEAIPKAGPIIKGLGGSVQDLALYMTAMREGGIAAGEGANALKSALGALINPTKVATGMFAGFGIDLKGIVQKNAGDVTATILELQAALDKLDPLQKQQALEQLFGKFQFARMNALFSNLGKQGSQTLQVMDLMKASSQELASVAGRELAQVTESASGKYRRALEGLKADLAGVGEQFLKINTALINVISNIVKFAGDLPGPIKAALSFFGMLTAVAGPLIMLTGVLGNFFGYIIKGVFHFKALFKGAEGWKLLTPEILAANKAGSMAEQVFYSDAKAAAVLNQALQALISSYERLEAHAAGKPIIQVPMGPGGLERQVNVASPYITPVDTRDFVHMNPVGMMTAKEKSEQTMFGVVPGPKTVNRRISKAPQVYMEEDLPRVQGVTAIGKVSTGVVAGEAAKFHTLNAALGMLTGPEIANLRKEVARTGLITDELSQAYQILLPTMQDITKNAADRSRQIVEELRQNKITADQARARIIALNREIELMMAAAAEEAARGMGRTIDVSRLPLVDQPAVDPKTGKSNMKELFRKKRGSRSFITGIARALGVKTYGAPYSIETTIPKKYNIGGIISGTRGNYGNVYNPGQHGAIVPGPNVNYDIIPANVPVGGFVLNQAASRANPDLVSLAAQSYNTGGQLTPAILTPGETVVDPETYMMNKEAFDFANATKMALGGRIGRTRRNYGNPISQGFRYLLSRLRANASGPRLTSGSITGSPRDIFSMLGMDLPGNFTSSGVLMGPRGGKLISISAKPATAVYGARLHRMPINPKTKKPHTLKSLNELLAKGGLKGEELDAWLATLGYMSQGGSLVGTSTQFLDAIPGLNKNVRGKILQEIDDRFYKAVIGMRDAGIPITDTNNPYHLISDRVMSKHFPVGSQELNYWRQFKLKTSGLNPLYLSDVLRGAGHSSSAGYRTIYLSGPNGESIKVGRVKGSGNDTLAFHAANPDWQKQFGFNNGGRVPGYNGGGLITALAKAALYLPNKINQAINYRRAKVMAKRGLYHGSRDKQGEYLVGQETLGDVRSRDMYYGMGFYSTTNKREADLYASGYNISTSGDTYGSLNELIGIPRGKYLDLRKKRGVRSLKWQDYATYLALVASRDKSFRGRNKNYLPAYLTSDLGDTLRKVGVKGTILDPVTMGSSKGYEGEWLAWANSTGVQTNQIMNRGGRIPGYNGGGVLSKAGILKKLGAIFSVNEGGRGYSVNALPRYVNTKAFDMLPISLKAKKFLYGALVDDIVNRSPKSTGSVPTGPITQFGRTSKTVRGFGSKDRYDIWQNVSGMLKNNPNLSEHDRAFFAKVNSNSQEMPWFVARGLGLNKGGMIPGNVRGYNTGGKIPGYVMGGGIARMLLPQIGSIGGSMLGQQLGGFPGLILGSILGGSIFGGGIGRGSIAFPGTTRKAFQTEDGMVGAGPLRRSYEKSIFNQTQFGLSLARNTLQGGKFTATLSKMALGLTKTNLVLAGVTAAAVIGYKAWQSYQEKLELTRKSFGLTSESAGKLGLKFKDYNSEIKNSLNTLSAIKERGKMTFESLASSGTPLNMTIQQYKKLKEEVKSTMAEQIKMIDVTNKADLGQLAIQLKEQFVNAGMSAEEASKKIYAAFQLSNKAKFTNAATVANAGFTGITNAQSSAVSSIKTFGLAKESKDAESQVNALNTALSGVDNAVAEIQKEWKKANKTAKEGLTEYQAMKQLQDQVNSKVKTQTTLSKELIDELAKQNPEIRNFANQQDTVLSLWQKMRLAATGYTGDLSRMNAAQVDATYKLQQALLKIYTAANASGTLKKQNEELKNYKSQSEKLAKAAKGQSAQQQEAAQNRIKELQKEIDLINKKADARKKALQEEQQDEDIITEIKKKQIEYQEALTTGNMAAAAAAQLDIQALTGQQQRMLAERAIEEKRLKDIAPKQAEIEKIQDAQNKIAAAATKASESLDKISTKYNELKEKIDLYNLAMANYATAIQMGQKDMTDVSQQLIDAANALGMNIDTAGSRGPSAITGKPASFPQTPEEAAQKFWDKVGANKININTPEVNVYTGKAKAEPSVTGINVTEGKYLPGGTKTSSTISLQDLKKEKIKVEIGVVFTDASGQKWKIVSMPNPYNQEVNVQRLSMGGMPKHYGPGGDVNGPGTSTSDSIPAYLSDGEYVIRAAAVGKYGKEFFDALNTQQFDMGKIANFGKNIFKSITGFIGNAFGLRNPFASEKEIRARQASTSITDMIGQSLSWLGPTAGIASLGKGPIFGGSKSIKAAGSYSKIFGNQILDSLMSKLPGATGLKLRYHGGPTGIKSGEFLKQDLRGWNFPGTYLTSDPITAAQYGSTAAKNQGMYDVGSIYKFGIKPGQKVSVLNLGKKADAKLKDNLISIVNSSSASAESKNLVISSIKNAKSMDEAIMASRSLKYIGDLDTYLTAKIADQNAIFSAAGITNSKFDLIKNFRSTSAVDKLTSLNRSLEDLPGIGGFNTSDDLNQWIITNISKFTSKEIPTNISKLVGASPRLQKAVDDMGLDSVGPNIAEQNLSNWYRYTRDVLKNKKSPGSIPQRELDDWAKSMLSAPYFGKNKLSDIIYKAFTGKHNFQNEVKDIPKFAVTGAAGGGYISPKYNIPAPSTTMVNPMPMGYNRGGIINRYDVGGLVLNPPPGTDNKEIATMVVSMLESKNLTNMAKTGGRGRLIAE